MEEEIYYEERRHGAWAQSEKKEKKEQIRNRNLAALAVSLAVLRRGILYREQTTGVKGNMETLGSKVGICSSLIKNSLKKQGSRRTERKAAKAPKAPSKTRKHKAQCP